MGKWIYLGIGKLKDKNRYKEAKSVYVKAKNKYYSMQTFAIGVRQLQIILQLGIINLFV